MFEKETNLRVEIGQKRKTETEREVDKDADSETQKLLLTLCLNKVTQKSDINVRTVNFFGFDPLFRF